MFENKPGNIVVIAKDFLEYRISGKTRFYSPALRKGRTKEFLRLYFFSSPIGLGPNGYS